MAPLIKVVLLAASVYSMALSSPLFTQKTLALWIKACPDSDFVLIDIRDPYELESTGVIGSDKCLPYNLSSNQGILSRNISRLSKNQYIVLYCHTGSRASSAAATLKQQGYKHVLNAGGITTWEDQSLLLSATRVKPLSTLPEPSMTATNECQTSVVKIVNKPVSSQISRSAVLVFDKDKVLPSGYFFDITGRKTVVTPIYNNDTRSVSAGLFLFISKF
ncbi:MAG: rhodanese-like domain-containing protein [Chitinispirillaceae bacterium]|nr:rhodanese-like domain-containing protein [Chitinispirillaceae bacterium]